MNLKGKYLAFVLDEESRQRILDRVQVIHPNVVAHHVTLEYEVSLLGLSMIDERPVVHCIGQAFDDKAQAILCSVSTKVNRADGKYFHITLSLADGVRAVESNNTIQRALERGDKVLWGTELFQVTGTVQLLDRTS